MLFTKGIMCYSGRSIILIEQGLDDLLLGYPNCKQRRNSRNLQRYFEGKNYFNGRL